MEGEEKQRVKFMDVAVELSLLQKRFTGAGIEKYGTLRSGRATTPWRLEYTHNSSSLH